MHIHLTNNYTGDDIIEGVQIAVNEIKILERLRWDPTINIILGVCREHGEECSLAFLSQFQADTLLGCLKKRMKLCTWHTRYVKMLFISLMRLIAIIGDCYWGFNIQ